MTRPLFFVLVVVALVYLPLVGAGYVWDDHALIEANGVLDAPTWSGVFEHDLWWGTGGYRTAYYRPFLTVTLLVDRYLLGARPWTAHLHSLAWHLIATGLVGVAVGRHASARAAAVAAAVFGLHPIQSEAVAWISARNDLLAGVGVLGAIVAGGRRNLPLTALATCFAMLAKESGAMTPLLLMAWGYAWSKRVPGAVLVASLTGLLLAVVLRGNATLGDPTAAFPFGSRDPLTPAWTLVHTVSWFVWPWPLTSTSTVYGGPPGVVAGVAALVALLSAGVAIRQEPRRAGLLTAFALVSFAPSVGGLLLYQTVGERYLYLPLIGVAALAGPILAGLSPRVTVPIAGAALLAISVRLPDWRDDAALFTAAARRQPDAYSLSLAGKVLIDVNRSEEALADLEASLRARPAYPFACRFITTAARDVLTWPEIVARVDPWIAAGCRGIPGFDDALMMSAARAGDWDRVRLWTGTVAAIDHSGRFNVVLAALYARDGDLLSFAWLCQDQEEGAGSFRARVLPLLQQPLAPNPPPL